MARVILENVHKNYGAPEDAVKGASFTVKDGEFFVMLGPSGCGKTTTLRMITGLETITSGTITIGDRVVNDQSPQERNVAMAFETYALYPPLTVYQNIAFPLRVMKLPKAEIDRRVMQAAESLSITDILDMMPANLAGGQKQRVSLARALVRNPTVFLMDEPLSHVDADVRHRARAEIKHMQTTTGSTVIYVTHDQVEAVALADRVLVMNFGVIQQIGTPLDLYYKPANLFVAGFIGEPPMNTVRCKVGLEDGQLTFTWTEDGETVLRYDLSQIDDPTQKVLTPYNGREIMLGVRPQRVKLGPPQPEMTIGTLPGQILVHEFLGKHGISQIQVGHLVVECVSPPDLPFGMGSDIGLSIDIEDLHFFDIATTNRIEAT